jgi:hypothetical protein
MTLTRLQKAIGALVIFSLTVLLFGCAVKQIWFREDDLGTIINGLIRSWQDFVRVFSSDCRSFIVPENYRRTAPNFISGFLRPMQNVFFTVIYYFFHFDPYAYYLAHVVVHALNAVLLFYVCLYFLPISFALLAGLMFSFWPDASWLPWIGTMQNSLSTLFLLITIFIFTHLFFVKNPPVKKHNVCLIPRSVLLVFAGIMFFFSLLSRENGIFIPGWLFLGTYLFYTSSSDKFLLRCKQALSYTWIFFVMNVLYVLMRMWAFGFATLERTYNNLFIRYPFLIKFFGPALAENIQATTQQVVSSGQEVVSLASQVAQPTESFWGTVLAPKLVLFANKLFSWISNLLVIDIACFTDKVLALILACFFSLFFLYAYRQHKKLIFFLGTGVLCGVWPGFLAYPCARYINLAYPFLIVLFVLALYFVRSAKPWRSRAFHDLAVQERKQHVLAQLFFYPALLLAALGIFRGAYFNMRNLSSISESAFINNQRFARFFKTYQIPRDANIIVLGSPFASDIQNIFQVGFDSLDLKLSYELFATLAEKNSFGCQNDYRITGVASKIIPIEQGFRLISQNQAHCGWWLQFSDHPIIFSEKTRAYEWTSKPYETDQWYRSSMGKFMINQMLENKYVTDISFIFDPVWINQHTVFVTWDTLAGCYTILPSEHLKK